jgi:hypothetical protein
MRNVGAGKAPPPTRRINRIMQNGICHAWLRIQFTWGFQPQTPGGLFAFGFTV